MAVWCVSYSLFTLMSGFASAQVQTVTAVSGQDTIKAGDMITGTVSDSEGPMMMVGVTERDSANRIVANSVTDKEGIFSRKEYKKVQVASKKVEKYNNLIL